MRRWIWIILTIVAVGMVSCVGLVGSGIWFFTQHVQVHEAPRGDIEAEFVKLRGRFKGQKPIIEGRRGMETLSNRLEARATSYSGPLPENLCMLVWEVGNPKRARICLPFWLLKMKSGKGIKLDVPEGDIGRLEISAQDLQRAGPALLLDEEHDGTRVLIWTE
jgi:hypothetical protein